MSNIKCVVNHPNLFLAVAGSLQRVPQGTHVTLSQDQAKRLGKKVMRPSEVEAVEVGEIEKAPAENDAKNKAADLLKSKSYNQ